MPDQAALSDGPSFLRRPMAAGDAADKDKGMDDPIVLAVCYQPLR
jgi:hypothetical protein